ncbi:MAG: 2-oxo-hepta-3-ene-1,7-dioic acid hydratase [Methylobacteriaceae bacterium]|nr:2-oxo-hepta-3-ene-1,7-dioic acid hydratase [Methylobacteriaceae bacterium]
MSESGLTDAEVAAFAGRLDEAERTRRQTRALSLAHPAATLADAYRVQAAWMALKQTRGRRSIGRKIGLTSKAMQAAVGIDEPDSGILLDDMVFADGGVVPTGRFIGLRVEAELAFVLGKPLAGPGCTLTDVLDATAWIMPALEILDTRIFRVDPETGAARRVVDTVADNAANAGIVTGGRPFRPGDHDPRWVGAICLKNGAVEETGLAAGVLNHPASSVAWLANRLGQAGETIAAGEVVLAGSFIRPVEVGPGDTVVADYGSFGTVSCHFG